MGLTVIPNDGRRESVPLAARGVRNCSTVFVSGSGLNSLSSLPLNSLSLPVSSLVARRLVTLDGCGVCLKDGSAPGSL